VSHGRTPGYAKLQVNSSVQGNGTVGTPFGFNLGNANTWTATQTFAGTPGVIGTSAVWTNTTNQETWGPLAGPNTVLTVPVPAATRTVTLPDAGGNSNFLLSTSTGGQSVTTSNAAATSLTINSNGSLTTNPAIVINGTEVHNGTANR